MRISQLIRPASLCLAVLLALVPGLVLAHNVELLRSDPPADALLTESPAQVRAWFNEEMQTGASTLAVYDAAGNPVDSGDGGVDLQDAYHASMVVSLPPLADGAYFVRWHVVLLDNDPTDGEFVFYVGQRVELEVATDDLGLEIPEPADPAESELSIPLVWIVSGVAVVLVGLVSAGLVLRGRPADKH